MHYNKRTEWPSVVPDPAAEALAEIAELMAQPAPGSWAAEGLCADLDPELHQPVGDEGSLPYRRQAREAIDVCRACPVLAECRTWALAHDEVGIWGAMTPEQRRRARQTTTTPTETPAALRPAS